MPEHFLLLEDVPASVMSRPGGKAVRTSSEGALRQRRGWALVVQLAGDRMRDLLRRCLCPEPL